MRTWVREWNEEMVSGKHAVMDRPEQEDEQRLRAGAGERRSLHLRGDESPYGEEIGPIVRICRSSLVGGQKVLLGNGSIASNSKIIRSGDARGLHVGHHDRCGKGNLVARPERKGSVLLWGWQDGYRRNGMFWAPVARTSLGAPLLTTCPPQGAVSWAVSKRWKRSNASWP